MTEIFISCRLLSLTQGFTYKSHLRIREGNIQNLVAFFGEKQIGSKSECLQNARFYRDSDDIEYPFSTLAYFAHVGSSIFIHVARKKYFLPFIFLDYISDIRNQTR